MIRSKLRACLDGEEMLCIEAIEMNINACTPSIVTLFPLQDLTARYLDLPRSP